MSFYVEIPKELSNNDKVKSFLICEYLIEIMKNAYVLCVERKEEEDVRQLKKMIKIVKGFVPKNFIRRVNKIYVINQDTLKEGGYIAGVIRDIFKKNMTKEIEKSIINKDEKYFVKNFDQILKGVPQIGINFEYIKKYLGDDSIEDEIKDRIWNYFSLINGLL